MMTKTCHCILYIVGEEARQGSSLFEAPHTCDKLAAWVFSRSLLSVELRMMVLKLGKIEKIHFITSFIT